MREMRTFTSSAEGNGFKQGLSQDFKNVCPKQQFQDFAHPGPDLATDLLQILMPTEFNSLLCQKKAIYTSAIS